MGQAALLRAILSGLALVAPMLAHADDFQGFGLLPGGTYSQAFGINADGSVVVGSGNTATHGSEAFRWTQSGGMVSLGVLAGGTYSFANAVNADGSVVVGYGTAPGFLASGEAFRWTQGGGMVGLGALPGGTNSVANAVNADGSVVVGYSSAPGITYEAFRWTQGGGMVGLGFLPGHAASMATAVSADGSVVVGTSSTFDFLVSGEAFRWTQVGGMVGLGMLSGGTFSQASGVSTDGSVVVGYGNSISVPGGEAFRWTQGAGMIGLGVLAGGTNSAANAVNADGSVVVGYSSSASVPGGEAFRWTAASGMKSVRDLLVARGVNMTGWTLSNATAVSADGTVIAGYGTDPSSNIEAWLARLSTQFGYGIITLDTVMRSFSGQTAMGQTGNAAIGNALDTFSQYAMQAHASQGDRSTPFSAFGYVGYDSDPASSGTFGITVDLPDAMVAGAAVSANYIKTNMVYDGSAKMLGGSAGAFVARVPDAGLQWLFGMSGTTLTGEVNRGYLNGSGPAFSQGRTNANGYGATARVGWSFDKILPATQLTPFVSYTASTIHFDSYTETTGVFPAHFNGFDDAAQVMRFGADARYTFAAGSWVWGTLASAHKINNSQTEAITGTLIGLFSLTAPANPVAKDWVETTVGVRWPAWKNGALIGSLSAAIPSNYQTTYQARLGVIQTF